MKGHKQQPTYKDGKALKAVEGQLRGLPPLTSPGEARNLKRELAAVAQGKAFLL